MNNLIGILIPLFNERKARLNGGLSVTYRTWILKQRDYVLLPDKEHNRSKNDHWNPYNGAHKCKR